MNMQSKNNQELADMISNWIVSKVYESNCKGVVFGLSGGLDSAVVAALCARTLSSKFCERNLPKENILGVIMPCLSQDEDKRDALLVANSLGIRSEEVCLNEAFNALCKVYPVKAVSNPLSGANIKARLRMTTLYYMANEFSYLVVGTGNKTEMMIGYSTKYGDAGCDILPIGDLYKTEVRTMAKELKIPEKIITKAPSAGLWPGQTDEEEMGITYDELDEILEYLQPLFGSKRFINDCLCPNTLDLEKFKKVQQMIVNSQHKRSLIPIFRK